MTDEQIARFGWIHRPIIDAPARVDDDAVERRALEGDRLHRLLLPVRVEITAPDQMRAHLFQPLRFDTGNAAREKLARLGNLGGSDPLTRLLD